MNNSKFTVVDHKYLSTGGDYMVSIFTVYCKQDNATRYVIFDLENFVWQTADTISNPDFSLNNADIIDQIVIGDWHWSALTCEPSFDQHIFTDEEFELFKYCQFEFIKKDCRYFDRNVFMTVDELSPELYKSLPKDYIDYLIDNCQLAETDGHKVIISNVWLHQQEVLKDIERQNRARADAVDFKEWLDDLRYDSNDKYEWITIAVAGNSIKIPFHADNYELLQRMIDEVIATW